MAHPEQRKFLSKLKSQHPEWFTGVKVLEIGSLNINGTVRDFFTPTRYLGVDVGPGPGVDLVQRGEQVDLADNSFDVAISAECFEHNPEWEATFANMYRMARVVIFTCASTGRAEHGTHSAHPDSSPLTLEWDYYRNLNEEDFIDRFDLPAMFEDHEFQYNPESHDLYFWGIKRADDTNEPDR
jgi:hypothetical protein